MPAGFVYCDGTSLHTLRCSLTGPAGFVALYLELDRMPPWARRGIVRWLSAHPNFYEHDTAPLSDVLAYKLDLWFSTSPSRYELCGRDSCPVCLLESRADWLARRADCWAQQADWVCCMRDSVQHNAG